VQHVGHDSEPNSVVKAMVGRTQQTRGVVASVAAEVAVIVAATSGTEAAIGEPTAVEVRDRSSTTG